MATRTPDQHDTRVQVYPPNVSVSDGRDADPDAEYDATGFIGKLRATVKLIRQDFGSTPYETDQIVRDDDRHVVEVYTCADDGDES